MTSNYVDPTDPRRVDFECLAYGPELLGLCFWESSGSCRHEADCDLRMAAERLRLWLQLKIELRNGDPFAEEVLRGITGPHELLGGPYRSTDDQHAEEASDD